MELNARISSTPQATVVTGTVARRVTARPAAFVTLLLGFWSILQGSDTGWFLVAVGVALGLLAVVQVGTLPDRWEPRARYLAKRLDDAMAQAGSTSSAASRPPQ